MKEKILKTLAVIIAIPFACFAIFSLCVSFPISYVFFTNKSFRMILGVYTCLFLFVIAFTILQGIIKNIYNWFVNKEAVNPFEDLIDIMERFIEFLKNKDKSIFYKLTIIALIILGIMGVIDFFRL